MTIEPAIGELPATLPSDPLPIAKTWLAAATAQEIQRNPNAMTIVSVGTSGDPSARIVLCKDFVTNPGYLVFYTNYASRKGKEFSANAKAAALFHWDAFGRQVRLEGRVLRSPAAESDAYFASRGWGSQLGAWGSDQSAPIASKEALVAQIRQRAEQLGLALSDNTEALSDAKIPKIERPPHWGGYRFWPSAVELWVEGADRIHDRALWRRDIEISGDNEVATGAWQGSRLQP